MARVQGVEPSEAGLFTRLVYWMTKRKAGRVVLPVRITAHHTRLLRAMGQMEMGQAAARSMDETLKGLAGIYTAVLIGCPF
ncbi:MAG: hypothetical protein ACR2NN_17020 [Bryobacteraceae bacterium]